MEKLLRPIMLLMVVYVGLALYLDWYGQRRPSLSTYDAIIVLGCRVEADGSPSLALQARTRKAVELYNQGYASKIILTGGVGTYAPAESVASFQYATETLGVDPSVFVMEEVSTSTDENAQYALQALPEAKNVLIVSDAYHVFRAERVFGRYFDRVDGSGRVPIPWYRVKGDLREVAALFYYWLNGRL